jgi:hypothetical protein
MKISGSAIVFIIFIVFETALTMGIILASTEGGGKPMEYQFINIEPNNRAGLTTYTMIFLKNGEIKYLYFDDPKTAERTAAALNMDIKGTE